MISPSSLIRQLRGTYQRYDGLDQEDLPQRTADKKRRKKCKGDRDKKRVDRCLLCNYRAAVLNKQLAYLVAVMLSVITYSKVALEVSK